jgi:hypothetical protein
MLFVIDTRDLKMTTILADGTVQARLAKGATAKVQMCGCDGEAL